MSWLCLLAGEFRVFWSPFSAGCQFLHLDRLRHTPCLDAVSFPECIPSIHFQEALSTLRKHDNQGQLRGLRPGAHAADGCTAWNSHLKPLPHWDIFFEPPWQPTRTSVLVASTCLSEYELLFALSSKIPMIFPSLNSFLALVATLGIPPEGAEPAWQGRESNEPRNQSLWCSVEQAMCCSSPALLHPSYHRPGVTVVVAATRAGIRHNETSQHPAMSPKQSKTKHAKLQTMNKKRNRKTAPKSK